MYNYDVSIRHICSYLENKHKLSILPRLDEFMTCSELFSVLEHCRKIKFSIYVHQTQLLTVLRWIDFVKFRKRFDDESGGVYISALEQCWYMKYRTYLHLTRISKVYMYL